MGPPPFTTGIFLRTIGVGLVIVGMLLIDIFQSAEDMTMDEFKGVMMWGGLLIGLGIALVAYSLSRDRPLTVERFKELMREPEFNAREIIYNLLVDKNK